MKIIMMEIYEHISNLLFKHNCVIIPDFGGFIANYKPAGFSKETHIYYPPSKNIVFNCNLKNNDGLLANCISNFENISYSDAINKISDFVNLITTNLDTNKSVIFNGIGTFIKQNDNLIFTPDNSINRLIEAFGLPVLQLPIEFESNVRPIFSKQITSKSHLLQKAAVVIPIVLMLALFPAKISKMPFSANNTAGFYSQINESNSILNNPTSYSNVVDKFTQIEYALYYSEPKLTNNINKKKILKDSTNYTDTVILQNEIKNKNTESNSTNETVLEPSSNKKHFIIAGSFVEMRRVKVFCKELINKNYKPELVKRDGKLRISVASFESSIEANKSIMLFREQHPELPVWLLNI